MKGEPQGEESELEAEDELDRLMAELAHAPHSSTTPSVTLNNLISSTVPRNYQMSSK